MMRQAVAQLLVQNHLPENVTQPILIFRVFDAHDSDAIDQSDTSQTVLWCLDFPFMLRIGDERNPTILT